MMLAASALAIFLATSAYAQNIVLFGDSLSDNGNGYNQNTQFVLRTTDVYPQLPYYQGRWSNGPSWIEVAASQLGVNLLDYGAAGATTGAAPAQVPPLQPPFGRLTLPTTVLSPTLFQQLNRHFLATNNTLSADPYYIIFIGGNDFFSIVFGNNVALSANLVAANVEDALGQLYARGARKFLLGTIGSLSALPVFTQPATYGNYSTDLQAKVQQEVTNYDSLVKALAVSFPGSHPGSSFNIFEWGATLAQLAQYDAAANGITNLAEACYLTTPNLTASSTPTAQPIGAAGGTLCSNPDSYLFWDQFHPSRVAHRYIGEAFVKQYGQQLFGGSSPSVAPGPSSGLPVLPAVTISG